MDHHLREWNTEVMKGLVNTEAHNLGLYLTWQEYLHGAIGHGCRMMLVEEGVSID